MSKLTIALLFTLLALASSQTWVLSWSDEFSDSDTIDTSKWNFETGNNNGWGNNELEYYTSNNAYISNGQLVIEARQESVDGFQYTSARMTTQNLFSTVYGKFEIRAQLPFGQGVWPAFWLLGDNIDQVGWPACGEIDIMELIGDDPDDVHGSTHGTGFDTTSAYYNAGGFSDGFHVYGVNWQPDSIEFYVDGTTYTTVTPSNLNGAAWPFSQNMFIILNLAIGGNWPGNPDSSTQFPQQFIIDYVRVWEIDWNN